MARILLVEDDGPLARLVQAYLVRARHTVITAGAGDEALALWRRERPELVVLDRMLPRVSGDEVLRRIRVESSVPVLMLTARESEEDRVDGFRLGADDYVVKPFLPKELVARVEALLRRARNDWPAAQRVREQGPFRLDVAARRAWLGGVELDLTPTEFRLLAALLERAGEAVSRRELEQALFKGWADPSALNVHVRHLRQKIEPNPAHPQYLKTVHGLGYRIDP